jgi:hypothetical protein
VSSACDVLSGDSSERRLLGRLERTTACWATSACESFWGDYSVRRLLGRLERATHYHGERYHDDRYHDNYNSERYHDDHYHDEPSASYHDDHYHDNHYRYFRYLQLLLLWRFADSFLGEHSHSGRDEVCLVILPCSGSSAGRLHTCGVMQSHVGQVGLSVISFLG